jgi:hypothetical protein
VGWVSAFAFVTRTSRFGFTPTSIWLASRSLGEDWSGRRDSNPRPIAWKAMTLPLSYSRSQKIWWRGEDSNLRSSEERWVYSPVPLTTRPPLHQLQGMGTSATLLVFRHDGAQGAFRRAGTARYIYFGSLSEKRFRESQVLFYTLIYRSWSWREDLNPRPADYKSAALPAELRQHWQSFYSSTHNLPVQLQTLPIYDYIKDNSAGLPPGLITSPVLSQKRQSAPGV